MGYVYKYVNKSNGKWYIGSHNGTNPDYTASGSLIQRALAKYGKDNFNRYIIYNGEDYRLVEELSLESHNAKDDELSYNLSNGSNGHSNKSRNKGSKRPDLSERNRLGKGRKLTEAHKAKIVSNGRILSDATKAKISASLKRNRYGTN